MKIKTFSIILSLIVIFLIIRIFMIMSENKKYQDKTSQLNTSIIQLKDSNTKYTELINRKDELASALMQDMESDTDGSTLTFRKVDKIQLQEEIKENVQ